MTLAVPCPAAGCDTMAKVNVSVWPAVVFGSLTVGVTPVEAAAEVALITALVEITATFG